MQVPCTIRAYTMMATNHSDSDVLQSVRVPSRPRQSQNVDVNAWKFKQWLTKRRTIRRKRRRRKTRTTTTTGTAWVANSVIGSVPDPKMHIFYNIYLSHWSGTNSDLWYVCSAGRQTALQSAAKNSSHWRSSFEQVADWLTSKEAAVVGLQQLSCDFERLNQQSTQCEVKFHLCWVAGNTVWSHMASDFVAVRWSSINSYEAFWLTSR